MPFENFNLSEERSSSIQVPALKIKEPSVRRGNVGDDYSKNATLSYLETLVLVSVTLLLLKPSFIYSCKDKIFLEMSIVRVFIFTILIGTLVFCPKNIIMNF